MGIAAVGLLQAGCHSCCRTNCIKALKEGHYNFIQIHAFHHHNVSSIISQCRTSIKQLLRCNEISHYGMLCCERFSLRLSDVTGSMFSVRTIDNLCREKVDDNMNRMVEFIVELVKIRDNILHISNDVFSLADIRDINISFLCTS